MEREFIGEALRTFDHPGMVALAGVEQRILVSEILEDGRRLAGGIAGDDPVHDRVGEDIGLLDPFDEPGAEAPALGSFQDAPFQLIAVPFDQLAWQQHQTLANVTVELAEAGMEQGRQLPWK